MAIEAASSVYELNQNLPLDGDEQAEGDDHIRVIKAVLKATFPGLGGALGRVISKSIGFTPGVTENTCIFHCTAALTVTLPAVAGVPDGTYYLVNAFGGDLVIDPNGTELINGQATVTVLSGSWVVVGKLGGAWIALVTALPSAAVHAAPAKATPADGDELLLVDSADTWKLKKFTWANIKEALVARYMALVAPGASGNILTSNGSAWTSAAPPAAGVTSVNGNTGAVTAAQVAAAATAGYGYTPAGANRNFDWELVWSGNTTGAVNLRDNYGNGLYAVVTGRYDGTWSYHSGSILIAPNGQTTYFVAGNPTGHSVTVGLQGAYYQADNQFTVTSIYKLKKLA